MNWYYILLLLLILASISWHLLQRLGPPSDADRPEVEQLRFIDYAHDTGTEQIHGTVSSTSGVIQSTWTTTNPDGKNTIELFMEADRFEELLNRFSSSQALQSMLSTDPDAPVDIVQNHILVMATLFEGEKSIRIYHIPSSSTDRDVLNWISDLKRGLSSDDTPLRATQEPSGASSAITTN